MKRLIFDKLIAWDKNENRLPILLYGARQVGKTYIITEFAQTFYPTKHVYVNFFKDLDLKESLQGVTSPQDIISILKNKYKKPLDETWLYVFDEVQEVPSLKTALKIFVDEGLKHKIICIGSYLGNTLNLKDQSFPVGKVELWTLYPMNFREYLMACGREDYITLIQESLEQWKPIPKLDHKLIMELLHSYLLVGGMPAVVQADVDGKDESEIEEIKTRLIDGYKQDIAKYLGSASEKSKCLSVYENIPRFFSKKHNRFILSKLDSTARYLNYEPSIKNLLISKIAYKINNIKKPCAPLITTQNEAEFKLYFNDCGFISYFFGITKHMLKNKNNIYPNQKGAMAENYVISEFLQNNKNKDLMFYTFKGNEAEQLNPNYKFNSSNTKYEIDLVLEDESANLVPIEIKYGNSYSKSSLNHMMKCKNVKYAIVFSSNNLEYDQVNRIIRLPLYCAGFIDLSFNRINLAKYIEELK